MIRILDFKGAVPRAHPRLIPDSYAQTARNTRLERGVIEPIKLPRLDTTLGAPALTIYKHLGAWLSWAAIVDAVPGPVAQDRLYYTGDAAPKMRVAGTVYPLKLAAPVAAPTLLALSAANPALAETIYYAYTYVTSFGEESQPSPLSAALLWSPGVTVRLSAFSAAPGGRSINKIRIYRSQTSATGATELFFVAEIATGTATYDHDLTTAPLVEPIPSTNYDPPIDTLSGLIALPNGMMAAFDGKDLYFCEPYQPQAWPDAYSLTVDYSIVGLAAFGSTLAVLTSGTPYILQGTHPENMAMERMDKALPCLSRRGIVDIGYACYFPSIEGLAMVSPSQSDIVTRALFTREQWQAMAPGSMVADSYNGRYLYAYNYSTFDSYDAGIFGTAVAPNGFDEGIWGSVGGPLTIYDHGYWGSAFGLRRIGSIDLIGDQPFFIESDAFLPDSMFTEPTTGALYGLVGGDKVMAWDDAASPLATQIWRSKVYVFPWATNFAGILVQTETALAPGDVLNVRVVADKQLRATITRSNRPERLPGNFKAKEWYIEIEGNVTVTGVAMGLSYEELSGLL